MPLNQRNIQVISPIVGTGSNATVLTAGNSTTSNWTYVPGPGAVAVNTNPQFVLTAKLTGQGLLLTKGGTSVGFFMSDLQNAAAIINPALTWVPNFANQPSNFYIGAGNTGAASFVVTAQDQIETDMTYQWVYANGTNVPGSGVYSNVTTNHINISNTSGLIGTGYAVVVTNPTGSNTSNVATLYFDPSISTQPSNSSVTHPAPASFVVVASGQSNLSYQWQYGNNTNITAAGVYTNVTTSALNISNSTGLNGVTYQVLISDTAGKLTSNLATLTVL